MLRKCGKARFNRVFLFVLAATAFIFSSFGCCSQRTTVFLSFQITRVAEAQSELRQELISIRRQGVEVKIETI